MSPRLNPRTELSGSAPSEEVRFLRVPTSFLGRLLDHANASPYAIKASKGPTFCLNEKYVAKKYGISRRGFQAGIRLMKACGVLERWQSGRAFATERFLPASNANFVLLDERLLGERSALVAFVLTVNLHPVPLRPADAAKRFGISARGTVRKLLRKSIELGAITSASDRRGSTLVARRGHVFERVKIDATKNAPAKKDPAHNGMEDFTTNERIPLTHGTRSSERGAPDEDFAIRGVADSAIAGWISLSNWRLSPFFKSYDFIADGEPEKFMDVVEWRGQLARFGGAPAHVATPGAHYQALEIAHELSCSAGVYGPHVMTALAFWVCHAHAQGKLIRSLAFIAEPLFRTVPNDDLTRLYDLPSRVNSSDLERAAKFAGNCVDVFFPRWGFPFVEEALTSTIEIDELAQMIGQHTLEGVMNGVMFALNNTRHGLERDLPGEPIYAWRWFDQHIAAAKIGAENAKMTPEQQRENEVAARKVATRRAAEAGVAKLRGAGVEVDYHKLLSHSELMDLQCRFSHEISPEVILLEAIDLWLKNPKCKVKRWANLHEAIRTATAASCAQHRGHCLKI